MEGGGGGSRGRELLPSALLATQRPGRGDAAVCLVKRERLFCWQEPLEGARTWLWKGEKEKIEN